MEKRDISKCLDILMDFEHWFEKLCEGSTEPEEASLEVFKPILKQAYVEGAQQFYDGLVDAHNKFLSDKREALIQWGKEQLR